MNDIIRWGIWGTGTVAYQVATDLRLVPGGAVRAVASRRIEAAKKFATRLAVPKYYGSLADLLNDPELDVIYVASPHHRHMEDCLACIDANKAVLCEKPFAINLAQAERIVNAARRRNVFCMEAMWTRFIPSIVEAKRLVQDGAIGDVRMIQGNFAYPAEPNFDGRLFNREMCGGALLDRGVYLVSLVQHLLGSPMTIQSAAFIGKSGVDEQSTYQLQYADGALADLSASLLARGTNEMLVSGNRGVLRILEPFYRADRLLVQETPKPNFSANSDALESPKRAQQIIAAVREAPSAKSLRRRLSPLIALRQFGRTQRFPFSGNGYQFELSEVNRCLREQLKESDIMPLRDSLAVMRTMDTLRSQWKMSYPGELRHPDAAPEARPVNLAIASQKETPVH